MPPSQLDADGRHANQALFANSKTCSLEHIILGSACRVAAIARATTTTEPTSTPILDS